ncbi:MAG: PH domain-containing protein [Microthrixaceae bacterium]|nr:PH domain-containing protein [Microthrixaceae bacterium]
MSDPNRDAEPFEAPGGSWQRVSPKLATARRVSVLPVPVAMLVASVVLWLTNLTAAALVVAPVGLLLLAWSWWLVGRQVRAIGFAERRDDLLVVSGIMFRRLVVVPYGRMQLVDLSAGPLDRALGLSTVQLHTAAATTDASIPGLRTADAAQLRDRLAAAGEQRSAGL